MISRSTHRNSDPSPPPHDLLQHSWPPMVSARLGLASLDEGARARIGARVEATLTVGRRHEDHPEAVQRLASMLAQVEIIAIDLPLRELERADCRQTVRLLEQIEDEIYHCLVFAEIAIEHGGLLDPIASVESVLDVIRSQSNAGQSTVLLNHVAEAWIENLFRAASTWGGGRVVFQRVLEEEARHVDEAEEHLKDLDVDEGSVRELERAVVHVLSDPQVVLPILRLAGNEGFHDLVESAYETHRVALQELGLVPDPELGRLTLLAQQLSRVELSRSIEPETTWRKVSRTLWDPPRSPALNGFFDVEVEDLPLSKLTAVVVAAIGRTWEDLPRIRRVLWDGEVWEQPVRVGVRVIVDEAGEALATAVVPRAHELSLRDVARVILAQRKLLRHLHRSTTGGPGDSGLPNLADLCRDDELAAMIPPHLLPCPVTVTDVGSFGLQAGFGTLPAHLGQSVEITLGRVEKKPVWRKGRYVPRASMTVCASGDHRVADGSHYAQALCLLERNLGPRAFKALRARPDTIRGRADLEAAVCEALHIPAELLADVSNPGFATLWPHVRGLLVG